MSLYPIFLKLEGHKVLIVGGGLIAEQKIEAVLRSATDVTVVVSADHAADPPVGASGPDQISRW